MSRRVFVLEDAEAELMAAVLWYEKQRAGLGSELQQSVDEAMRRLAEGPVGAVPVVGISRLVGARKIFVKRFPYAVVFVEQGSDLWVLAFAHHHRKPGYWRSRRPPKTAGS